MSSIKKTLFGSSGSVSTTPATLYPASTTQTNLQNSLYDTTSGILEGAADNYNTGTGLLSLAASGELSGDTAANLKKQAMDLYDDQVGSIANNMAFKNLGSNTMTQNALSKASSDASDWYMNNYLSALQTQGSLANSLASQGLNATQPAQNLYNGLLSQQTALSTPAQTVVNQGSSGLLGGIASGLASNPKIFCFIAGTMIDTPAGEKAIEEFVIDDSIIAYDEAEYHNEKVYAVLTPHEANTAIISTMKGNVTTTPLQPFLTQYGFKLVRDLVPGDEVIYRGDVAKINKIEAGGKQLVYDLKVTGCNTYIANGFIVKGGDREWA